MTKQEADALKTYIDFMADQTAGPTYPKFKDKETWRPVGNSPHVMRILSFAEFKELETYPDRCQVYAHKSLHDDILYFAGHKGYALTAEVPRDGNASILEFTKDADDEPQYISIEDLLTNFYAVKKYIPTRYISHDEVVEFTKLVRVLTIAEYKGDGCYEAEPNNIKLPKDFTL